MANTRKKNLIVSYKNLPKEAQKLFAETYPEGYEDFLQRIVKPNGDTIYTVPLETDDTFYMVKFDVRVDSGMVEEDNDAYDGDDKGSDDAELAPLSEALDKEEGVTNHNVGPLRHGSDYEEFMSEMEEKNHKKKKRNLDEDDFDFDSEDEDDFDSDMDDDLDEEDFEADFDGPSDEDLALLDESLDDLIGDLSVVPTTASLLADGKSSSRKSTAAKAKEKTEPAPKKSTKEKAAKAAPKKAATAKRATKKKSE